MLALLFLRMSDSSFAGFFGCGGANRGAGPDAASSMEKQSEKINCEAANAAKRDCGSGRDNGAGTPSSGTDAVREATVGEVGTEEPEEPGGEELEEAEAAEAEAANEAEEEANEEAQDYVPIEGGQ